MENASKALLIAGGILLAILIMSALVFMFSATKNFSTSQEAKTLAKQISEFNSEYEAYNKTIMYGVDVITVINKSIDYNQRRGEKGAVVNIKLDLSNAFTIKDGKKILKFSTLGTTQYDLSKNGIELKSFFTSNSDEIKEFKTSIFRCKGTTYDETGRINSMTFEYRKDKNME